MYLQTLLCLASLLLHLKVEAKPTSDVAVIGSVFCDSCSENAYSKRSYFLKGAKVLIQCKFGRTSIAANRTTDRYGVYRLDIPLAGRFKCREGRETRSMCRAVLTDSASSHCSLAGLRRSASHAAVRVPRTPGSRLCVLNMNAVSSRPRTRDAGYCGSGAADSSIDSSLFFFWPLYPPLGLPWLHWPPLPFAFPPLPFPFNVVPLPDPSSLPFSLPPWLLPFLDPASLPFPFSLIPPLIPIPTPPPPYPFSLDQP
ncbi:uncharacterized protein M6B38_286045 [Iris pallida]|uniref:Pollen Ole e 1 allergen and extensin family protein n=1 Tax=Iris pallida TaxID=29817 RepID=A0AAX6GUC1_IRIPA|nr:uncharacterized protein M6B38_345670 [Iris pallida]KAJ6845761.1 uncharacterized protein M6B38_286045 [Iris pallida]